MSQRILLVVPRMNIGGAETYVRELALGLKARGYEVFVASGGGALAKELGQKGIKQFWLPLRLHAGLAAWLLSRIVKKYSIDIVHANSAAAGIAAVKIKSRLPIKIVYTAHGVFGHNAKELTIEKADKIICVSNFVERYAEEKGYSPEKLVTIYTGINTEKFASHGEEKSILRRQFNIPEDAFTLAIVARIKNLKNKGHEDILDILQNGEKAKAWHLLVIGKGKGLRQLKAMIKQKGLSDRVHCIGHSSQVQTILPAVDAVVLPSKLETFGLVLAEAMAMAKPAAAYAVGGTPEIICDGDNGFLAKLNDKEELYQKLSLWSENRSLCQQMGQRGRACVEERFAYDKMLDAVEALYQDLLTAIDK